MLNIIKKAALIILFIPNIILAATCAENDTDCKTTQLQLQALQKAGIKPTTIPTAPGTPASDNKKKNSRNQIIEPQPFNIPLPMSYQPKKTEDSTGGENQDTITKPPQTKPKPIFNIFTPNANTDDQNQKEQDFVFQPPKSPLQPQPVTQQPTGIQYQ
ncbi:MAG: hypothetical protein ACD_69C00350G0002 [uncultured bacterium]|nr:MAG: hypothetical protein ACD_69C00350G0002 [uncultured bacterium]OGT08799.1 MAG: hypothetical protein A2V89_02010 [Gammaproteobacteria bacterium RBG_16_37_9]